MKRGKSPGRVNPFCFTLNRSRLFLCLLIGISFFMHLWAYTFSFISYCYILGLLTILYVVSKPVILRNKNAAIVCGITMAITLISFMRSLRTMTSLIDVISLCFAMLIVIFFSTDDYSYGKCIKIIVAISLLFAIGVLLQRFLPNVFSKIINLLPQNYTDNLEISSMSFIHRGLNGFTLNAGSSAAYLCTGIIALLALGEEGFENRVVRYGILIALFVALLFTGKRGHTLFLILTLLMTYGNDGGRVQKKSFFNKILVLCIVVLSLVVLFISFGSTIFANIPFISGMIETFNGLLAGDDVSSMRLSLYSWAIHLFKNHPFTGIGWGDYRTTVVGNVSRVTSLDVHNIYLQLLCETGIVGFLCFMTLFYYFIRKNYILKKSCSSNGDLNAKWRPLLSFSYAFQIFFLLYGFTGNDLYDQFFQIMYCLSCAIILSCEYYFRNFIIMKNSSLED